MYKYRKAIVVLFFCLLGDIAYSSEKYSKKSQKSFNTFLELSQSSEYTKLLKKDVSSFIGLQKELAVFYQADAYFRLKNYKKSYETYKQLPASLGQVFVNKIIFYFIQAKQTNERMLWYQFFAGLQKIRFYVKILFDYKAKNKNYILPNT